MGDAPQDSTEPRRPASELGPGTLPVPPAADPLFVGISAICDTVVRLTGVDGAAVAVLAPSMGVRELVYATDALAQQLDELQFTLGEGPCVDAYQRGHPQMFPSLGAQGFEARWPAFTAELVALGVAAVFAYPVPGDHRPLGVLELYRRTEGRLSELEQGSAQVCATALQTTLESNWHEHLAQSTSEQAAVDAAAVQGGGPMDPFTRTQVHVAAGMIAVQLNLPTTDALDRLRAHAFAQRRSIVAVAADVVARRLSFRDLDDDPGTPL